VRDAGVRDRTSAASTLGRKILRRENSPRFGNDRIAGGRLEGNLRVVRLLDGYFAAREPYTHPELAPRYGFGGVASKRCECCDCSDTI